MTLIRHLRHSSALRLAEIALLAGVVTFVALAPKTFAAVGMYRPINYQGKLSSTGGLAITNGQYNMRFKIFTAPTGGVAAWTETWNGSSTRVTSTGGLFSIALGSITTMTGSVDFNSDSLYLQVEFDPGNDGVYEEVFMPRRRFASVPYAHNANTLDGLDSTQFLRSDADATASGTITVRTRSAAKIGIDIISNGGSTATGALRLSTAGGPAIVFGSGGVSYDTNLYRVSANTLKTDDALQVVGTLSGSRIIVSGNANISGALLVKNNITTLGTLSGYNLTVSRSASISGTLIVKTGITSKGSVSGSTIDGFGLGSCNGGTQKLLYNATTDKFECGTISASASNFSTGNVLTIGDTRYVRKSGDTMTGSLIVQATMSGRHLIVSQTASFSGAVVMKTNAVVQGALSGSSLYGFGLGDCSGSDKKLIYNNSTGKFTCSNDLTAASGLEYATARDIFVNQSGDTMTGSLVIDLTGGNPSTLGLNVKNTISGSRLIVSGHASVSGALLVVRDLTTRGTLSGSNLTVSRSASISGTLIVKTGITSKGSVSGSTIDGFGLGSCNGATQKLLYNSTTDTFECGTITAAGTFSTGNVLTIGDTRYVRKSGDTMTGSLIVQATMSGRHLIVSQTASFSGAVIAATNLTVKGTLSGSNLTVSRSASISGALLVKTSITSKGSLSGATIAGFNLGSCNSGSQRLLYNYSTQKFECGTYSAPTFGTGNVLTIGDARYVKKSGDTMTGALLVRGTLSGTQLVIDRNANISGALLTVGTIATRSVLSGATLAIQSSGTVSGSLLVKGTLATKGILSGSFLTIQKNATISGALLVKTSITSKGSMSGVTIAGFNLGSCNSGSQRLLYNYSTQKFECGTYSAPTFGTGNVLTIGDARYVKKSGDTMTGALVITITNGNINTLGLRVINTISGAILHGERAVTSSGLLMVTQRTIQGSGALVVEQNANSTGAYLRSRATKNPLLVLDTSLTNSSAAPHILFGYNGFFDVALFRSANQTLSLSGHLLPAGTNLYDLGSSTKRWRSLYLSGGTIFLGQAGNDSAIHFNSAASRFGIDANNDGTDEMSILSTGNIGIGKAQPSTKLEVVGTISGSLMTQNGAGNNYFLGNVGVGTTSPSARFNVKGASDAYNGQLRIDSIGDNAGVSLFTLNTSNQANSRNWQVQSNYTSFGNLSILRSTSYDGNPTTSAIEIDLNGNVGIGSLAPKAKLDVFGTMSGKSLTVSDGTTALRGVTYLWPSGGGAVNKMLLTDGNGNLSWASINDLPSTSSSIATDTIMIYNGSTDKKITKSDFLGSLLGAVQYKGTWSAATNTPTLTNVGSFSKTGHYYISTDSGTVDFGSGSIVFGVGDWVINNAGVWEKLSNSNTVASVFGRTGAVSAQVGDYSGAYITNVPSGIVSATNIQSAINQLASSFTGLDLRYVKKQGDTMTGTLLLIPSAGLALNARGTISGSLITQNGTGNNYFRGNLGIGTTAPETALEVIGTMSGLNLAVSRSATVSGALLVKTSITSKGSLSGATIAGFNLGSCNSGSQRLLYNYSTQKFECGTYSAPTFGTGNVLTIGDVRYVKKSGDTMTGALRVRGTLSGTQLVIDRNANISGALLTVGTIATRGVLSGATLTIQNSGTISGALLVKSTLATKGTLSGKFLTIQSSATISGALLVKGTLATKGILSGSILTIQNGATISGALLVKTSITSKGSISGSTIAGFNLGSCNGTTQKLLYNYATQKFECGTDQTGGGGGAFGTGNVLTIGDARYLRRSGGTMTGQLVVNITNGNINTVGLKVINTLSGAHLHAEKSITSSGTLIVRGNATIFGTLSGATFAGAGLTDCDQSTSKLLWDSTTNRFSCGADQNTASTTTHKDASASYTIQLSETLVMTGSISLGGANSSVWISASLNLLANSNAQRITTVRLRRGLTCAGAQVGTDLIDILKGTNDSASISFIDSPGAGGVQSYAICALTDISSPTITQRSINLQEITSGADIAEVYYSVNTAIAPGTVVSIDPTISAGVKASSAAYERLLLGVVSTLPGSVLNGNENSGIPNLIALSGRVPVKVTTENGPIHPGDLLTSSSIPGVAMRATKPGPILGKALTNYDDPGIGEVMLFVKGDYYSGDGLEIYGGATLNVAGIGVFGSGIVIDTMTTNGAMDLLTLRSSVSSSGNTVFRVNASGAVYSDSTFNSQGADYAEWFKAPENNLQPGDLVCVDVLQNNSVRKCVRAGDPNLMGIVSTNPAFIGNNLKGADGMKGVAGYALVGLIGQVPAKVSLENGVIRPGDSLTSASVAGFARKAKAGESTVGVALEGYDGTGKAVINVLISRRNQSLTVETVEQKVLDSIAEMNLSDEIQQMVQSVSENLNLDDRVTSALNEQFASIDLTTQINAAIETRLSGATLTAENLTLDQINLIASAVHALATNSGSTVNSEAIAMIGGLSARVLKLESAFSGSLLHAAAADFGTLSVRGTATFGSGMTVVGNSTIGPISISGTGVTIGSLVSSGSLKVMGPITVAGLAEFLGDVHIKGELIVSGKQAGFATIPKSAMSVTVAFSSSFLHTPIVTATSDDFTPWRIRHRSQTGFTLELKDAAENDINFNWFAISSADPQITKSISVEIAKIPFPVNALGQPVSSDAVWNGCIQGHPVLDSDGQPFSCARYHDGFVWQHPDLNVAFTYNPNHEPPLLFLPAGYVATTTEVSSSLSVSSSDSFISSDSAVSSSDSSISSDSAVSSSDASISSDSAVSSSDASISSDSAVSSSDASISSDSAVSSSDSSISSDSAVSSSTTSVPLAEALPVTESSDPAPAPTAGNQ